METIQIITLFYAYYSCSDPTYEAWKRAKREVYMNSSLCSDPTYEAWKLFSSNDRSSCLNMVPILPMRHGNFNNRNGAVPLFHCSDPTYEAWKRVYIP